MAKLYPVQAMSLSEIGEASCPWLAANQPLIEFRFNEYHVLKGIYSIWWFADISIFLGRPWPPVQDGLLADRRSTKRLKEFVLLSSPSTTEEVVQVTWPPKKKSKHSNTEKRFGPLLQDLEYIMTAMDYNLPLVILCDLFCWNGAGINQKKWAKMEDWIGSLLSQKSVFFQASTWNWKGYTEYWGFQVEFVGFGEVDLGMMSQEALCFSSFIGNSRKVSSLSSELEELSLALLFKNMGTSTLICGFSSP